MQTREVAVQVLKRAREIISKPEHWTKEAFARDEKGFNMMALHDDTSALTENIVMDERAVCWCPDGAIRKAIAELRPRLSASIDWEVVRAHARMGLWDAFKGQAGRTVEPHPMTMWSGTTTPRRRTAWCSKRSTWPSRRRGGDSMSNQTMRASPFGFKGCFVRGVSEVSRRSGATARSRRRTRVASRSFTATTTARSTSSSARRRTPQRLQHRP